MSRSLERRIRALEARHQPAAVYAVRYADCDRVQVLGGGEEIPLAEFERRYPRRQIVLTVASADLWEAI